MGGTARQFNKTYMDYKKQFKKPLNNIALLMVQEFTDEYFVDTFKRLYPIMWDELNKKYKYWHDKNKLIIKYGKKSRYNFRKPFNFILDCSFGIRAKLRKSYSRKILSIEERARFEAKILKISNQKLTKRIEKQNKVLYRIQEIEPRYASIFMDNYFKINDLHERLEIIRELSKYKSDKIVRFFYKVNACTRNFSLKKESMQYIQNIGLPFVLRRKKKGKKNYIDNEVIKNNSKPEVLMQRLYVDKLEKIKIYDVFISHNSKDQDKIVKFYKILNKKGYVAYVDWVNDKFDLKREWCDATTSLIIKERIKQSRFVVLFFTDNILSSQWCPWELGYADALGKKICVFNLSDSKVPEFYLSYSTLCLIGDEFYVCNGDKQYCLNDWIK